jgi:hypothetical protein
MARDHTRRGRAVAVAGWAGITAGLGARPSSGWVAGVGAASASGGLGGKSVHSPSSTRAILGRRSRALTTWAMLHTPLTEPFGQWS